MIPEWLKNFGLYAVIGMFVLTASAVLLLTLNVVFDWNLFSD